MHPFPHTYVVKAIAGPAGDIGTSAAALPDLAVAAPAEFDGPGDRWSPEALLCASVATCFVLTFRAQAKASGFEWAALECRTESVLDRVDRALRFTRFVTHATLKIPAGGDADKARALLQRAEDRCLVANSLNGERHLQSVVEFVA